MITLPKLTVAERIESGRGIVSGGLAMLDGVVYERRSNGEWRRVKDQQKGRIKFDRSSAGRRRGAWPSRRQLQVALLIVIRAMGGKVVLKEQQEQMLDALALHLGLGEAQRRLEHPTAGTRWANVVHWAKLGLAHEGKLDRDAPFGIWALAREAGADADGHRQRSIEPGPQVRG
jgi:hypothetical protein